MIVSCIFYRTVLSFVVHLKAPYISCKTVGSFIDCLKVRYIFYKTLDIFVFIEIYLKMQDCQEAGKPQNFAMHSHCLVPWTLSLVTIKVFKIKLTNLFHYILHTSQYHNFPRDLCYLTLQNRPNSSKATSKYVVASSIQHFYTDVYWCLNFFQNCS